MSQVVADDRSELGALFEQQPAVVETGGSGAVGAGTSRSSAGIAGDGVTRAARAEPRVVGRGPVPVDSRKFRYDRTQGATMPALAFGASKADRLDADVAGDILHRIHETFGIDREVESVLTAFDRALFFEHTVNGASLLQPGRGVLKVGSSTFDLAIVKQVLGVDQRRFFRAFADEIADVNRAVLAAYDPYDPSSVEKHGQLVQVAVERGLQKYPYLAHDSSDAGVRMSVEERVAVMNSKRVVLETTVNNVDRLVQRPTAS